MKLSSLAIALGLLYVLPNIYGILKPTKFGEAARKFPRYTPVGYPLMLLATAWFVYNVYREPIADFAVMKPYLCGFFAAVGVGACIFVKDFLPVRGLAVLLLLAAKLMVDTARWADTSWRLVITTLAYVWIIAGMWLTISPWRMRDLANWITASENRIRLFTGARVAFGVFVLLLGLTVFRSVEAKAASPEPPQPMQISGEGSR
jgi:uncharacterized protein YjeT (DUF2065 family)